MYPTLVSFGKFSLSTFGVFFVAAFVVLLYIVWRHCREKGFEDELVFDNIIVVATAAFIGARTFYVATHWSEFSAHIFHPFMIWRYPGLSYWGGLIAALPVLFIYTRLQKLPLSSVFDSYAISYPWLMIIFGLAIFFDGSVAGGETKLPWGLPAVGTTLKQHPIGLYAAILGVLTLLILVLIKKKLKGKKMIPGSLFWLILMILGVSQLLLAYLRSDTLYWQGFSIDYILATIIAVTPTVPLFKMLNGKKVARELALKTKTKIKDIWPS